MARVNTSSVIKVLRILSNKQKDSMLQDFGRRYSKFEVLISTILSARSKDETTMPVCEELFKVYNTPSKLADADVKVIERIVKKTGFYKTKARYIINTAKMILRQYNGKVPDDMESLLTLPGVGRKVAGCVLVYAHNKPAIPVDTHVHRLSNRLGWVKTNHPEETEEELMELVPKGYWKIVNEVFVVHGKTICNPITPRCSICPVERYCKKVNVKRQK
jgi:endonuclease-3